MTPNEKVTTTGFTLRKISKLVSKIDRRVGELTGDINKNVSVPVVIHDEVDAMLVKVRGTHAEWADDFAALQSLIDIRVTLRGALGSANQSAGINHAVTELRGLEQKLCVVNQVLRTAGDETQLDLKTLARRIDARRETQKSTTIDVVGYGSRARASTGDSADLPTLTDDDIATLEELKKTFQNAIETTHDKLEMLNSSVGIELPDDVVETLTDLEILGL